jgi:hypothetical protein
MNAFLARFAATLAEDEHVALVLVIGPHRVVRGEC